MADARRSPLYLARSSYRRRRLIDAQRLLPIFLFLLFLLPLLWGGSGPNDPVGGGTRGYVYIFTIWILAIGISAWIARALMRNQTDGAVDASVTNAAVVGAGTEPVDAEPEDESG